MNTGFLRQILFIDIETVPLEESYDQLDDHGKALWDRKALGLKVPKADVASENLYERAGIYAEFGKIICVSFGYVIPGKEQWEMRIKSFTDTNEKSLLERILPLFGHEFGFTHLCAHNGKEFDFPYLCRRMIVHNLSLPKILDISGLKPWEICHYDTLEMWKFGDYKHYTSLTLLAHIFGIENLEPDMDGSKVMGVYYEEKNLDKIAKYCASDVAKLIQVFLRMKQVKTPENIKINYISNG